MHFYKEYNLPHPPVELVNSIVKEWIEKHKTFNIVSEFPNLKLEYIDDYDFASNRVVGTIEPIKHIIADWLKENVCKTKRSYSNWIFRMLDFTQTRHLNSREIYPKHLDTLYGFENAEQNIATLIYNITDSRGDVVFYQEKEKPVLREDRPIFTGQHRIGNNTKQLSNKIQKFGETIEVYRCSPKPQSWYLLRSNAIHGVINCSSQPRAAFQLRLSEGEVRELFPDFKLY